MRLTTILLTSLLLTTVPAFASADSECLVEDVACRYDERTGQDCAEERAYGSRDRFLGVNAADASASTGRYHACGPTREGGHTTDIRYIHASAAGADVSVEYKDFRDNYWGDLAFVVRELSVDVTTEDDHSVGAYHGEGGLADPSFPDGPYCWNGVYADDAWVENYSCPAAPLLALP